MKTNVSIAIIKPHKGLFKEVKSVNEQVAFIAQKKPNLIILPRYTNDSNILTQAYNAAKQIEPGVVMLSQTQHVQRFDLRADDNPLSKLYYEAQAHPYEGNKNSDLDMLVLFGEQKIDPKSLVFASLKPEGYLIWVGNHGNSEVFHKRQKYDEILNYRLFENTSQKIKRCSWYDLKF